MEHLAAAELRIKELEKQLIEKDIECMKLKKERYEELLHEQCRERLRVVSASKCKRSVHMDVWSCDELAGWFRDIHLDDYSPFILAHSIDGVFLLGAEEECWSDMVATMGLESVQEEVLKSCLVPFRARHAHKCRCLEKGDYAAVSNLNFEDSLDIDYVRAALGVRRQDAIESNAGGPYEQILTLCHEKCDQIKQGGEMLLAGFGVCLCSDYINEYLETRQASWKLLGQCCKVLSYLGNDGTPEVKEFGGDDGAWAVIHQVDEWSCSSTHCCWYIDLSRHKYEINNFNTIKLVITHGMNTTQAPECVIKYCDLYTTFSDV